MAEPRIIAILGTIAKQEKVRLSERVPAGMNRARMEGTNRGRATRLAGYHEIPALAAVSALLELAFRSVWRAVTLALLLKVRLCLRR